MKTILAIYLCLLSVGSGKVRYDGFKACRVIPANKEQVHALKDLEELNPGFSFWVSPTAAVHPVDIMVPPHRMTNFEDAMKSQNITYNVFMDNVQDNIEGTALKSGDLGFWSQYNTLDEIYNWLYSWTKSDPDTVKVISAGHSYQGRDIVGVHVSFKKENANRSIFIEGGIHAREWISPATVTYILNEIMTSSDPKVRNLTENHDWYIFPSINPDGYVYTFKGNRLWKKNRTPYGICYGADLNRNWDYHFNEKLYGRLPCTDMYNGPKAFSEVETKAMSDYIASIQSKLIAYVAFQSYSQLLLIPYGDSPAHVENYDELYSVGLKMRDSLASRHGTKYTVGNTAELTDPVSGGSIDWVKGNFHTPITYTYKLRDTGRHGFLLPPEEIIPSGEETFDSIVTMLEEFSKSV